MIKLLALDLDGTLLDSHGKVTAKNLAAIRAAEDRGVLVTIATGRRFRDARPLGLEIGLNAPLITHNGALLKLARDLSTVAFSVITPETSAVIVRVGKLHGGDALVSIDPVGAGSLLYERVSEHNIPLQKYITWSRRVHGEEAGDAVMQVESLEDAIPHKQVIHISFSGPCAAMAELRDKLEDELDGTVNVLTTVYPRLDFTLIDVLPPDASKGVGLEKLAHIEDLRTEELMVIGDNFNDLEMLETAGTAVVMGNSDPSLLERPEFYTTLSNDESGVAAAIERFILNEESI